MYLITVIDKDNNVARDSFPIREEAKRYAKEVAADWTTAVVDVAVLTATIMPNGDVETTVATVAQFQNGEWLAVYAG